MPFAPSAWIPVDPSAGPYKSDTCLGAPVECYNGTGYLNGSPSPASLCFHKDAAAGATGPVCQSSMGAPSATQPFPLTFVTASWAAPPSSLFYVDPMCLAQCDQTPEYAALGLRSSAEAARLLQAQVQLGS